MFSVWKQGMNLCRKLSHIPRQEMLLFPRRGTRENIRFSCPLLRGQGAERIIPCTRIAQLYGRVGIPLAWSRDPQHCVVGSFSTKIHAAGFRRRCVRRGKTHLGTEVTRSKVINKLQIQRIFKAVASLSSDKYHPGGFTTFWQMGDQRETITPS